MCDVKTILFVGNSIIVESYIKQIRKKILGDDFPVSIISRDNGITLRKVKDMNLINIHDDTQKDLIKADEDVKKTSLVIYCYDAAQGILSYRYILTCIDYVADLISKETEFVAVGRNKINNDYTFFRRSFLYHHQYAMKHATYGLPLPLHADIMFQNCDISIYIDPKSTPENKIKSASAVVTTEEIKPQIDISKDDCKKRTINVRLNKIEEGINSRIAKGCFSYYLEWTDIKENDTKDMILNCLKQKNFIIGEKDDDKVIIHWG